MIHKIATIINYCTLDHRYLAPCIDSVREFSHEIVVPVCDHFFDGSKENSDLLLASFKQHPDVKFAKFSYDHNKTYLHPYCSIGPKDNEWKRYWHSTARLVGYHNVSKDIDYILFADVDEIFDTKAFRYWLENFPYKDYDTMRFMSHLYFREPTYRAKLPVFNVVMCKKERLSSETIFHLNERLGIYQDTPGEKIRNLLCLKTKQPMIHHFSWVRTKEEMKKKTACWGHSWEKDWEKLINEEFASGFKGKDFWSESPYEVIEKPFLDVFKLSSPPEKTSSISHVVHETPHSIRKKMLHEEFDLL